MSLSSRRAFNSATVSSYEGLKFCTLLSTLSADRLFLLSSTLFRHMWGWSRSWLSQSQSQSLFEDIFWCMTRDVILALAELAWAPRGQALLCFCRNSNRNHKKQRQKQAAGVFCFCVILSKMRKLDINLPRVVFFLDYYHHK